MGPSQHSAAFQLQVLLQDLDTRLGGCGAPRVALAVLGEARVTGRAAGAQGREYVELSWLARVRGTAASDPGVVGHGPGLPVRTVCLRRHRHDGAVTARCEQHGTAVESVMERHSGGGIRCVELGWGASELTTSGRVTRCGSTDR
ncbi:hypothetical protein [Streptomyces sp. NPDC060031]|uniref:hypothetical protein n=1 Tax=Streptomyces sp. NPDC060031 TaxID=3347043 RepID=UPI0036AB5980